MADPVLILADEPTGNLDSRNAYSIMQILLEINRELNKTIVMVTHNLELARMTKSILKIRDGMIEGVEVLS